jgi:hypothetical protein
VQNARESEAWIELLPQRCAATAATRLLLAQHVLCTIQFTVYTDGVITAAEGVSSCCQDSSKQQMGVAKVESPATAWLLNKA